MLAKVLLVIIKLVFMLTRHLHRAAKRFVLTSNWLVGALLAVFGEKKVHHRLTAAFVGAGDFQLRALLKVLCHNPLVASARSTVGALSLPPRAVHHVPL